MDLIDYEGDSIDNEPSIWTFYSFKKYFADTYWKIHKHGGAIPWTLKETMLLKRMMEEFKPEELAELIVFWHINTPKSSIAYSFSNFYACRVDTYYRMKEATGEFTWE